MTSRTSALLSSAPTLHRVVSAHQRYSKCRRERSSRLKDYWTLASETLDEPLSLYLRSKLAQRNSNDIDSISKNDTWTIVDRPSSKTPKTAKWIFELERNSSGQVAKHKAQTVARGFQQDERGGLHGHICPRSSMVYYPIKFNIY